MGKYTLAEMLQQWARRHGRSVLAAQRDGRVTWLAMDGPQNEWASKGAVQLCRGSVFELRPAMRRLKGLWEWAETQSLPPRV